MEPNEVTIGSAIFLLRRDTGHRFRAEIRENMLTILSDNFGFQGEVNLIVTSRLVDIRKRWKNVVKRTNTKGAPLVYAESPLGVCKADAVTYCQKILGPYPNQISAIGLSPKANTLEKRPSKPIEERAIVLAEGRDTLLEKAHDAGIGVIEYDDFDLEASRLLEDLPEIIRVQYERIKNPVS